jgi:hypothetical protein
MSTEINDDKNSRYCVPLKLKLKLKTGDVISIDKFGVKHFMIVSFVDSKDNVHFVNSDGVVNKACCFLVRRSTEEERDEILRDMLRKPVGDPNRDYAYKVYSKENLPAYTEDIRFLNNEISRLQMELNQSILDIKSLETLRNSCENRLRMHKRLIKILGEIDEKATENSK